VLRTHLYHVRPARSRNLFTGLTCDHLVHIFRSRMIAGACITMFLNGWNFVVQIYYIPTFYQLVYGYSATKAGAMLLPITLVQTAASTLSGLVVHWIGRYRKSIVFGWACWAVGLSFMATLDSTSGVGKQIGYSILVGVGVGNTLQPYSPLYCHSPFRCAFFRDRAN
jgi:cyanate permease